MKWTKKLPTKEGYYWVFPIKPIKGLSTEPWLVYIEYVKGYPCHYDDKDSRRFYRNSLVVNTYFSNDVSSLSGRKDKWFFIGPLDIPPIPKKAVWEE